MYTYVFFAEQIATKKSPYFRFADSVDSVQDEVANLEKDLLAATDLRTDESKENLKDGAMAAMRESLGNHLWTLGYTIVYPLVNVYIAIENGHRNSWFTH